MPGRVPESGAGNSFFPQFSRDGLSVAFLSHANNLVTNDNRRPFLDLFRRDLVSRNTTLVSVCRTGVGGGNSDVVSFSLSTNGLFVAFETSADDLLDGDVNNVSDIYVRDVMAGMTSLISVNASGSGPGNGPSFNPLMSGDGRYVVFESDASDLVTNDFNKTTDIFIRDRLVGTTRLVSLTEDGQTSPDGPSQAPAITPDARFVAFVSRAANLVAGITNRLGEVYVRDLVRGSNLWANAANLHLPRESAWGAFAASNPVLSDDGRFVAFETSNGAVIRVDLSRPTNSVLRNFPLEAAPPGTYPYYFQDNPRYTRFALGLRPLSLTMSSDGRYVALVAVAIGTNGPTASAVQRIDFEHLVERVDFITDDGPPGFYFTNVTHTTQMISLNGAPLFLSRPVISADGLRVAYLAGTTPPETLGGFNTGPLGVWVRDMQSQAQWMSRNRLGTPGGVAENTTLALSADGLLVAWDTRDDEMLEADANAAFDVYVRSVVTGDLSLISERHPDLPEATGRGRATAAGGALSADGRRVVLRTDDSNLGRRDTNRFIDAYVSDLAINTNQLLSVARNPHDLTAPLGPGTNDVLFATITSDGRYAAYTQWGSDVRHSYSFLWRDLLAEDFRYLAGTLTNAMKRPILGPDGRLATVAVDPGHLGSEDVFLFWSDYPSFVVFGVPWEVGRATLSRSGSGNGTSTAPILSPDGKWIAFLSQAGDFTPEPYPPQEHYQVLAREIAQDPVNFPENPLVTALRLISYTTASSTDPSGRSAEAPLADGATNACFSGDARYLVFEAAPRLIYRHDLLNESVITITTTQTPQGTLQLTNSARVTNLLVCADCWAPSVSGDGRYVAFEALGTTLGTTQLYVRDLELDRTELVSANLAGDPGNESSSAPLLSFDARYVVFASKASDLVANDTNRATDIFVRDRTRGVTLALSQNYLGTATGNRGSTTPLLSADGRTAAFESFASDLVPGDYNDTRDVFVVHLAGVDDDRDGMDDAWEMTYFNTLARDGTGDFDGDGQRDAEEFRTGTNPADHDAALRLVALQTAGDKPSPGQRTTVVFWDSAPGRTYRVQTRTSFDGAWTNVPGDVVATGFSATKSHTVTNDATRFYRVLVQ
ncbi:MAG TPA: hypothetical protein VNU68_25900 [Verrucomicrobiae bacterium]|nr:hypothetical protein [Verrucomicrobiae bacterium]